MWSRQHLFEVPFQEAKAERENVAAIQEDFLKRSFGSLISQADAAIIAADEEIERGVQGAEGRLRKAELVKEQHQQRRQQRLEEAARGRNVLRGDVAIIGSALLLPLPVSEQPGVGGSPTGMADTEVEQVAVGIARAYEVGRGAAVRSVERDNVGFDLLSTVDLERRCKK